MIRKALLIAALTGTSIGASAQEFGVQYINEVQTNFKGNVNWQNFLRLDASLAIGKCGSIDYASIHTYKTLDRPVAEDWQVFSNIDNDNLAFGLAVLGYSHRFGDRLTLFAGVRNVNEDYFTSDGMALFGNSSHGIFPTVGENYPLANYPLSSLGIHAHAAINGRWTVQGSLYNGVARPLFGPEHGLFDIRKDDGIFFMGDVNYRTAGKLPGSYFAGISASDKIHGEENTEDKANVAYWLYGEQSIYQQGDTHIDLMAQFSQNVSVDYGCKDYVEGGVLLYNVLTKKIENTLGMCVHHAHYDFGSETVYEATYRMQLSKHIALQPCYQHIRNSEAHYNVAMLRMNMEF